MCLVLFALVRIVAVWGRPVARFPDTHGYESLNFFGSADRFWPVTLVYWLVRNDIARVVVQTGVQIVAVGFLATAVISLCGRKTWTGVMVLVFACTPQITRFDSAILSESLGLSYLALALGFGILAVTRPSTLRVIGAATGVALLAMTRSPQVFLLGVASLVALIAALRAGTQRNVITAMSFVLLTGWGFLQIHNNQSMSTLVFYTVLDDHIVHDPGVARWFADHGMPYNAAIEKSSGYLRPHEVPTDVLEYVDLPSGQMPLSLMRDGGMDLARWVKTQGWKTYGQYIATHPGWALRLVEKRADFMLNPADNTLLPLRPHIVVPRAVFGDYQWWCIAAAFIATFAVIRRRRWTAVHNALVGSFATVLVWFAIVAHTSGLEHGRHAITVSVALRLLCIVAIAFSLTVSRTERDYRGDDG